MSGKRPACTSNLGTLENPDECRNPLTQIWVSKGKLFRKSGYALLCPRCDKPER